MKTISPLIILAGVVTLAGCVSYDMSKEMRSDFKGLIQDYKNQAEAAAVQDQNKSYNAKDLPSVAESFAAGWRENIDKPISNSQKSKLMSLEDVYVSALKNSSQIRVFSDIPLIRETGIQEAKGPFDTHLYVESKYDRQNDPVGNTLTTGGPNKFTEEEILVEAGLKKKLVTGTELKLSQETGSIDNNSTFFVPNPQSKSRLKLSILQPLMQGNGIAYNRSILQIAEIDSAIARNEFVRQTESHLLEVTRTYWSMYLARGTYLQKRALVDDIRKLTEDLTARENLDAVKSQVFRARAALAERKADLVRSEAAVRNAQDRMRALVNDPELTEINIEEIIPTDHPMSRLVNVNLQEAVASALENRPEVDQAFLQLKAAAVRERMQRNELLPKLNLLLEGYYAGLDSGTGLDTPVTKELGRDPGYMAGISFDVPLENNAAEARLQRRRIELRQQMQQFRTTLETVLLEVKVSVREVKTAYRDMQAKYDSLKAAQEELEEFRARMALEMGSSDTGSQYLGLLIDSNERALRVQEDYLRSVITYNVALTTLERAKGNLLKYEGVSFSKSKDKDGLPIMIPQKEKPGSAVAVPAPKRVSKSATIRSNLNKQGTKTTKQ